MKNTLLFALIVLSYSVYGQTMRYYPDNSCKVFNGTREQTLAWCGGFNNPQFSMADLNRDGLPDLVVYESGKGVSTFINRGTSGNPDYRYMPQYALNFPPVYNYLVLTDYNCDGIADLFHSGFTGYSVYTGYYNSSSQLCFRYYQDLYYSNDLWSGGTANAFNNPGDIPAIVDVDNDGDIDFLSYNILGGTINFYKNMRTERGLPCDSISIALKDRCWGKVYQGYYRTHVLQYSCDNSGLLKMAEKTTHSGNTPTLFDWDMDGDMDYLDGSISYNDMVFLKNGKVEYGGNDSMISQDTMWQNGGKVISIPVWPTAYNIDIDNDGKKDLIIAPNAANSSENYKCIWYYKNYSTAGRPDWRFMSDSFLTDKTVDVGTAAYPALFDYNKDSKPDVFIGSGGYRQSDGTLKSRISLYLNGSTPGNPSLSLQTNDFLNIDALGFEGTAPCFGDMNNDGKTDLLIGHTDGTISFYGNHAASNTVQPVWRPDSLTLNDDSGNPINVYGNAAPFVYDVDKDGKPDLLIGSTYGTIAYYRNVSSTPGTVALKLVNSELGQAKVDNRQVMSCFSTPFVGKIDNTGRDYLLVGSNSGKLYVFDSIQSGDTTVVYPLIDDQYSFIDSTHLQYNHSGLVLAAYGNLRAAPVVGDLDGDGNYEMLVGQIRGGVNYYKRKLYDDSRAPLSELAFTATITPNPASDQIQINWTKGLTDETHVDIKSVSGVTLWQGKSAPGSTEMSVPVNNLSIGVYFASITNGLSRTFVRFVVLH